jgi:zinc protease
MTIRFHAPKWPLHQQLYERISLWHLAVRKPLCRVFWVWEVPALQSYHPLTRIAFLTLLRESQPEKLATLRSLGFRLSEEVHLDGVITGLEGLTENLPAALEVVYRLWTEMPLTEGALQPIVERLVQERRRAWAYPSFRATAYLEGRLWGRTYAIQSLLSPEEMRTLRAEELQRFYEELLRKSLRHLIVVSPTVPRVLFQWIGWQGALSYRLPLDSPAWGWYTETDDLAQQASLRIAYPGLRRSHPWYAHFRLALMHLGGYFGSRLMQEIREKGGYTYGIHARAVEAWAGSYFLIESEIDKARAAEATQKILDIVSAWAEKPFENEQSLLQTRNYLLSRLSLETPREWASTLAHLLLHGYRPEWYLHHAERLSQLELSDYEPWIGSSLAKPVGGVIVGSLSPIFAA